MILQQILINPLEMDVSGSAEDIKLYVILRNPVFNMSSTSKASASELLENI